jgi:hypothetical protein
VATLFTVTLALAAAGSRLAPERRGRPRLNAIATHRGSA